LGKQKQKEMITEFEIEYKTESGHDYGKYVCPICKEKIKSRLSPSYLSKISSCTKCRRIKVKNKFLSENRFLNGKNIATNCEKCDVELNEANRARNNKSGKLWCICNKCYSQKRKTYRNNLSSKIKSKEYALKRRESNWNNYLFSLVKKRYPDTDLSPEYIKEMWNKQNGLCFWFKIPMTITAKNKFPSKPSIDRIDNDKQYTKDNCVLCCYSANIGRNINNVDDWNDFLNLIKQKNIEEYKNENI